MSFYTTNTLSQFNISNVACQQCNATEISSVATFTCIFGIKTGAYGLEGYVSPINLLPTYGQFQFTVPSSSMTVSFLGSLAVKKVIGVVSLGSLSGPEFDISYPTVNTLQISMNSLPSTWTGSMIVTVML